MRRAPLALASAFALSIVLGTVPGDAQRAKPPLKIGVIISYTGPNPWGGPELDAAWQAYMAKHGDTVAGRKVEVIRRDAAGPNPDLVSRLARELIAQEHVDFLSGIDYTPTAVAAGAISTSAKVPLFVVNAATSGITLKNPYMSRYGFNTAQCVIPLAKWAYQNGIKTVYSLYANYGPGIDAGNNFAKTFTSLGGKIVGEDKVPIENVEFTSSVQRVKDAKPDALFVFTPAGPQTVNFFKAFDDAGLRGKIKIISTGDVIDPNGIDAIGDRALGVVTAYPYSEEHPSPLNREFVSAMRKINPRMWPNFEGVQAYDAINAIYHVVAAQNGETTPERTMELLKGYKWESPRGPVQLDPTSRDPILNIYIRRVERRGNHLASIEFETVPMVKDPNEMP
jgi:branched-chain amino acid transport system substrate-binding protein